jgi:hypothetical protein
MMVLWAVTSCGLMCGCLLFASFGWNTTIELEVPPLHTHTHTHTHNCTIILNFNSINGIIILHWWSYWGYSTKRYEMYGTWNILVEMRNAYKILICKHHHYVGDLGIDERITQKWIFKKNSMKVETAMNRLIIGSFMTIVMKFWCPYMTS